MPGVGVVMRLDRPVGNDPSFQELMRVGQKVEQGGKVYYKLNGQIPLPNNVGICAHVADDRTVVVATESAMQKMLAVTESKGPLADRLRTIRPTDDLTVVFLLEPYREQLAAAMLLGGQNIPENLSAVKKLPENLVSIRMALNLTESTLFWLGLEATNEEAATEMQQLANSGLHLAKTFYPTARANITQSEFAWAALAIADQAAMGSTVTREGVQVILKVPRPERLANPPPKDLIAASGFNDAKGMWADTFTGTPFRLGANGGGGLGEPGWVDLWSTSKTGKLQISKESPEEGDGNLFLSGSPMQGGVTGRKLARPETGVFLVEQLVRVPEAGDLQAALLNREANAKTGPQWQANKGTFKVLDASDKDKGELVDTGIAIDPDKWHKVSVRVDVQKGKWKFSVDGKEFDKELSLPMPEKYINAVQYMSEAEMGAHVDAVQLTRIEAGPPAPGFPMIQPFPPRQPR